MVLAAVDLLLVHEPRCRVAARTRSGSMYANVYLSDVVAVESKLLDFGGGHRVRGTTAL